MLDPDINPNGVSKYSIYLYKFLIWEFYAWILTNFCHVVLVHAQQFIDIGQIEDDHLSPVISLGYICKFIIIILMTVLYELRSLFASLIHLALVYEGFAIVIIINRERNMTV